MAKMTEAARERLLEIQAQRRAKVRLLKDLSPGDLQVMCDYVESEMGIDPTIADGTRVVYLKYASAEQVTALLQRIPHVVKQIAVPFAGGSRMTLTSRACFRLDYVQNVLKASVTAPGKYMSAPLVAHGDEI